MPELLPEPPELPDLPEFMLFDSVKTFLMFSLVQILGWEGGGGLAGWADFSI